MSGDTTRLAVLGYGALAQALAASLAVRPEGPRVGAALIRGAPCPGTPSPDTLFHDVGSLIAWRPDLVVECAGHGAVASEVPCLLAAGIDVVLASIGALSHESLHERLQAAARAGGGRLILVSGAVGGLDALSAARHAGLADVHYEGRKPPRAWLGTPAEQAVDLDRLDRPAVVFEGDARAAASAFPKNANVTAAVALAGVGFERTRVTLVADPGASRNAHRISAAGAFGRFTIDLENAVLEGNPRTSRLAMLSLHDAVLRHFNPIGL